MKIVRTLILILVVQIFFNLSAFAAEAINQCKCDFGHYFNGVQCTLDDEPLLCTDNYEPVCGCDGLVYSNSCGAQISGVKVFTKGLCALNSDFNGRWKARDIKTSKVYTLRLSIKDGRLSGFVNNKKILPESSSIKSTDLVSISIKKKKKEKTLDLKLISKKEMSLILDGGITLKARRVN